MFEFKLPDLGEGIHEGELLAWHVTQGAHVNEDDPLCDMETDKATVTIPSPRTGIVAKLNGSPGDIIHVGQVLAVIDDNSSETAVEPAEKKTVPERKRQSQARPRKKVVAAPATRRLARELGVDITLVSGTGAGGKVTPEDVRAAVETPRETTPEEPVASPMPADVPIPETAGQGIPFLEPGPLPDFSKAGSVETVPIRSLRRKTAVRTTTSSIVIPHVAHMDEWDVTDIESQRKKRKQQEAGHLTLLSFIVRATASLLRQYPEFNASVDTGTMQIIHKKYYHIGFAADTPKGLMVPVVRRADQKSVMQIAADIQALAQKGQNGSIEAKELSGSTFTITNVGVIGGTGVLPVINHPESAILGLGRAAEKPVVKAGEIVIRKILPATLCFDHRVADGVRAAKFMRDLKERIEDPMLFLTKV